MPKAYEWQGVLFCPTCIVNALTKRGRFKKWRRTHRLSDDPESDLDSIAETYGVDRTRAQPHKFPQPLWTVPDGEPLCPACLRWFD